MQKYAISIFNRDTQDFSYAFPTGTYFFLNYFFLAFDRMGEHRVRFSVVVVFTYRTAHFMAPTDSGARVADLRGVGQDRGGRVPLSPEDCGRPPRH